VIWIPIFSPKGKASHMYAVRTYFSVSVLWFGIWEITKTICLLVLVSEDERSNNSRCYIWSGCRFVTFIYGLWHLSTITSVLSARRSAQYWAFGRSFQSACPSEASRSRRHAITLPRMLIVSASPTRKSIFWLLSSATQSDWKSLKNQLNYTFSNVFVKLPHNYSRIKLSFIFP
jgi:hypothetical protein